MQAGTSLTFSNTTYSLPPLSPVICTHTYQRTLLRFSHQEVQVIQVAQDQSRSQVMLDQSKMLMQLERCSQRVQNYKIQMIFPHANYIYLVLSIEQNFFFAYISVSDIKIELGNVFQSEFIPIYDPQGAIKKLTKMRNVGFQVFESGYGQQTKFLALMVAAFSVSQKSLYLCTLILGAEQLTVNTTVATKQLQGDYLRALFIPGDKSFVLASQNSTFIYHFQLSQSMQVFKIQCNKINLIQPPFFITHAKPYLLCVKCGVNESQDSIFCMLMEDKRHEYAMMASKTFRINNNNLHLKVLFVFEGQMVATFYNGSQCLFFKNQVNKDIILSTYQPKRQVMGIEPLGECQILVIYDTFYDIVSLLQIFQIISSPQPLQPSVPSQPLAPQVPTAPQIPSVPSMASIASIPSVPSVPTNSNSNGSLTYSISSSSQVKDKDNSSSTRNRRWRRQTDTFKYNKQIKNNQNIFSTNNLNNSSPPDLNSSSNKDTPVSVHKQNAKDRVTQFNIASNQKVQVSKEERQISSIKVEKPGVKFNRIQQAVIPDTISEQDNESQSPKNSTSKDSPIQQPLSNEPPKLGGRPVVMSGPLTPPKQQIKPPQSNTLVNEFISFGVTDIVQQNSDKSAQVISFNPNDISAHNMTPKVNTRRTSTDEYELPAKLSQTVSFGKELVSMVSPLAKKEGGNLGQKEVKKQATLKYRELVEQIQWKMNKRKILIEKKNELLGGCEMVDSLSLPVPQLTLTAIKEVKSVFLLQRHQYCKMHPSTYEEKEVMLQKIKRTEIQMQEDMEKFRERVLNLTSELCLHKSRKSNRVDPVVEQQRSSNKLWDKQVKLRMKIMNLEMDCKKLQEKTSELFYKNGLLGERVRQSKKSDIHSVKTSTVCHSINIETLKKNLKLVPFTEFYYTFIEKSDPIYQLEPFQ